MIKTVTRNANQMQYLGHILTNYLFNEKNYIYMTKGEYQKTTQILDDIKELLLIFLV